jgi:signal peptidase
LTTITKFKLLKKAWKNEYVQTTVVIGLILLVVFGFWYGSQLVLNSQYPVLAVVSGSMCIPYDGQCDGWTHPFERTLHIGDLIVVQGITPADLNANYPNSDIIVFRKPGNPDELIVHRIVAVNEVDGKLYFRTKGDGNGGPGNTWPTVPQPAEYDPWEDNGVPGVSQDNVVGKVIMRVPLLGHVVLLMRNPAGIFVVILLVILLVIFEFVAPMFRRKKSPNDSTEREKEEGQQ